LRNGKPGKRRANHHFTRELHARRAQVEGENRLAPQAAQAAVKIADARAAEQPPDETKQWIAEIAMQQGHCAGRDAAGKAVSHYEIGAVAQSGDEGIEVRKIIGAVGVAHDDEASPRRRNA
jgi:hypothetical protein